MFMGCTQRLPSWEPEISISIYCYRNIKQTKENKKGKIIKKEKYKVSLLLPSKGDWEESPFSSSLGASGWSPASTTLWGTREPLYTLPFQVVWGSLSPAFVLNFGYNMLGAMDRVQAAPGHLLMENLPLGTSWKGLGSPFYFQALTGHLHPQG